MLLLVSLLPIIVPLTLLMVFRLSARLTMTITAFLVLIAAITVWGMYPDAVLASSLQGAHRALTIIWILIGATALLYTVQGSGAVKRIRTGLMKLSSDMRVQVVIIGFGLISMIEGVSGFGTPAIIAAPLLVALGFRPLVAASVALIGNTVACAFGSVATPIYVGMENIAGFGPELIDQIARQVTIFDLVTGTLLPLALIYMLVVLFSKGKLKQKHQKVREIAPWAIMVGLSYSLTAFVVVRTMGVEFASVLAGSTALIVSAVTAYFGFLMPKTKPWRKHIYKPEQAPESNQVVQHSRRKMSLFRAWLPYIIMISLLVVSRVVTPVSEALLSTLDLSLQSVMGFESINSAWQVLYSPGTLLLIAAVVGGFLQTGRLKLTGMAVKKSLRTGLMAAAALVPTLIMVQIFANSGLTAHDIASMPVYIGEALGSLTGQTWPIFAPALGALGAFITGSVTVSTLTFSMVQESIAASTGLSLPLVLSLQLTGAVAGNIIAIHNVVAVAAVVGLINKEGSIIRHVAPVTVIYVLALGTMGLIATALS